MSLTYADESPAEAMARNIASFLRRLAGELEAPEREPESDGLASFEEIRLTQCVRLAGEWWWIRAKSTEHDLEGNAHQFLIVGDADHEDWSYPVGDGERFAVAEPF